MPRIEPQRRTQMQFCRYFVHPDIITYNSSQLLLTIASPREISLKIVLPRLLGMSVVDIIHIISKTPPFVNGTLVDEIDFSKTALFEINSDNSKPIYSAQDITDILEAVPKYIHHLNLLDCKLHLVTTKHRSPMETQQIYSAIGSSRFKTLTLEENQLGDMPTTSLINLFGALKQERLHLRKCYAAVAPDAFTQAIARLPEGLKYLDVSRNRLGDARHMKAIISALPKNLDVIDIGGNDLEALNTPEEILAIFTDLPPHCRMIGIDLEDIKIKAASLLPHPARAMKYKEENASLLLSDDVEKQLTEAGTALQFADYIRLLQSLFQTTRQGLFFSGRNDIHMQMQISLLGQAFLVMQKSLTGAQHATSLTEIYQFLNENSYIKTQSIEETMSFYNDKCTEVFMTLPDKRKAVGARIIAKILEIARLTFEEISKTYDIGQNRLKADGFPTEGHLTP